MDKIRLGVVGAGAHSSENILPALAGMPEFALSAICTRGRSTSASAAERWSAERAFSDYRAMLQETDIQAVIVVGDPQLHFDVARHALQSGVHIFAEKPVALTLAQLQELVALAETRSELATFVGQNFRFAELIQKALRYASVDGPIRAVRLEIASSKPQVPIWGLDSTLRSFLYSVGIHGIDLAISILGKSTSTQSTAVAIGDEKFVLCTNMSHDRGVSSLWMRNSSDAFRFEIELVSDSRTVRVSNLDTLSIESIESTAIDPKATTRLTLSGLKGGFDRSGYRAELSEFYRSITEGTRLCSFNDALMTTQAIEALTGSIDWIAIQ